MDIATRKFRAVGDIPAESNQDLILERCAGIVKVRKRRKSVSGHVYILKNSHIPKLVKIGFTERTPATRAAELSGNTGVPGEFEVVFSWLVADPADIEKRIHLLLAVYRRTGEFFELSPMKARLSVAAALTQWGVIGVDGLSFDGWKVKEQEQATVKELQRIRQQRQDEFDFEVAIRALIDELELRERHECATAYAATELKGIFSLLRSSDTPARQAAIQSAAEMARKSLANDLALPWLVSVPSHSFILVDDAYFTIADSKASRSTVEVHRQYVNLLSPNSGQAMLGQRGKDGPKRLPKGTSVETSKGWELIGRALVNTLTGETLENAIQFSAKRPMYQCIKPHDGRHFSDEPNLGAYHCKTLGFFVGEIVIKQI